MKLLLLFLALLTSLSVSSQFLTLDTKSIEQIPCEADTSTIINKYKDWSLYQTIDNSWSGEKYMGTCPNLKPTIQGNQVIYVLDLSSIDPEKALFLAYEGPELELDKNQIYGMHSLFSPSQDVAIRYGDDCANGMCSGIIIRAEHSDPLYSDTLVCNTFYPYTRTNQCDLFPCFSTEKTERNAIVSGIYKLTIDAPSNSTVNVGSFIFDIISEPTLIDQPTITVGEQYFTGDSYDVYLFQLIESSSWYTYLVTHQVPGLPSETNQSFIELEPQNWKPDPTIININIDWEVLRFQKYSQLIGALHEGSEPKRHTVNLNLSSDMCLQIVELIGTSGTNFRMNGGTIDFTDTQACVQVRDNSAIYIEEGQQVYLGRDGVGNINLRSGGSIVIKNDAELIFGGKLILTPYRPYTGDKPIHVDLQGGGHMEFTKDAKILNNVFGDELFLYVFMNGGTIDLTKLSKEDKAKVILIYPENATHRSDLKIFPNPAQDRLTIYNKKELEITTVELYNNLGMLVYSKHLSEKSPTLELNVHGLATGLYTLITYYDSEKETSKIIIE